MAKGKTINMEKALGKLSPEAKKSFAKQYNGGLGSGMTPEEYKKSIGASSGKKSTGKKK